MEPAHVAAMEPSEDEKANYYNFWHVRPRLVARTDRRPWYSLQKKLQPIMDDTIIKAWTPDLRNALLASLSRAGCAWTFLLPVRILSWAEYWGEQGPNDDSNVLLIGVRTDSTDWQQGNAVVTSCLALLNENGIDNMQVEMLEMGVVPLCGPATMHNTFEPKYNGSHLESHRDGMGHFGSETAVVNEAIMPFLPLPGQCIQQVPQTQTAEKDDSTRSSSSQRAEPFGSLCCYLQLDAANGTHQPNQTTYALTSRHVAVHIGHDYDKDYVLPFSGIHHTANADGEIQIAWGASDQFSERLDALRNTSSSLRTALWPLQRRMFQGIASRQDEEALHLLESCENPYLIRVKDAIRTAAALNLDAQERRVGHVVFAGKHGRNADGCWNDWALIALDGDEKENDEKEKEKEKEKDGKETDEDEKDEDEKNDGNKGDSSIDDGTGDKGSDTRQALLKTNKVFIRQLAHSSQTFLVNYGLRSGR